MQTYLAIFSREPIADSVVENVERLTDVILPFSPHIRRSDIWRSQMGQVMLWVWDNGPDNWPSGMATTQSMAVAHSGYVLTEGKIAQPSDLLAHDLVGRGADGLGGNFSICLAGPDRVRAWVPQVRLEQVYWTRTKTMIAVSNRALASHLVAHGRKRPAYSRAFVRSLIAAGFPTTNLSPFEGTSTLPPGGSLVASSRGVRVARPGWGSGPSLDLDQGVDRLVQALVESVGFLPQISPALSSALTGGKDSRLISAALRAADVPFTATTGGVDEHPDVVLAAQVAAALGVPHRRYNSLVGTEVDDPSHLEHAVIADSCRRLFGSDGTHPVFESVGREVRIVSSPNVVLGGQGGELLRGGFAKAAGVSHRDSFNRLKATTLKHGAHLTEEAQAAEVKRLRRWFLQNAAWRAPADTLWRYYAEFRAGRWAAAGWAASSVARPRVWPYFDAGVVEAIRHISNENRINELSIVAALRRLAPEVANIPLAGGRWQFEREGPIDGDLEGWRARAPHVVSGPRANFDWRLHFSSGLGELMTEMITTHFDMADVVDMDRVERLLAKARTGELDGQRSEGHFLWMIFSVALLLSNQWLDPSPPLDVIRFPLPASS